MKNTGLIQVYNTFSKKTNFAPFGLAMRAVGQGLSVLVVCLAPHELAEGLGPAASRLKPRLAIRTVVRTPFTQRSGAYLKDPKGLYLEAKDAILVGSHDVVILIGIHELLEMQLISINDLITLCGQKDPDTELVFSGERLPEQLIEKASLVTEMIVKQRYPDAREQRVSVPSGVEVITGKGKGKTTYCLGKAMLISGMGIASFILQVIKSPKPYGEVMAIEKLPNLRIRSMGKGFLKGFSQPESLEKHADAAKKAWKVWLEEVFSMKYGLLVLDEINVATSYGLIPSEKVKEMILLKPKNLQILLSGRNAHPDVISAASTVIEMKEIKHPFHKGIKARKGIEF